MVGYWLVIGGAAIIFFVGMGYAVIKGWHDDRR